MSEQNGATASTDQNQPEFVIQRLYVKDLSLEVPESPQVFLEQWKPEIKLDLGTATNDLGDDAREVVLTVTVTVKLGEKTAFLAEVKQAGIFTMKNFDEEQIKPLIGSYCPNVLYPYAREVITDAVVKAGFPQLYLNPINFDALYAQHQEQEATEAAES